MLFRVAISFPFRVIITPCIFSFKRYRIRIAYKTDSARRKIGNYEECDYRSWISILGLQCSISPVLTARLTDRSCSRVTCFRDGWINESTLKRALHWLLCFPLLKINRGRRKFLRLNLRVFMEKFYDTKFFKYKQN